MGLVGEFVGELGRVVWLREDSSDRVVLGETFEGRFHVPPEWMLVPGSVLDLGSNCGLTLAHYRVLWPQAVVVGVEPDRGNAAVARLNVPDVVVLGVAVGAVDGWGRVVGSQEYAFQVVSSVEDEGDVEVVSLRTLVKEHFGGLVDFVKVDVEGAEDGLLRSLWAWHDLVGSVLVELHGDLSNDDAIVGAQAVFAQFGFLSMPHRVHPRAVFAWK